MRSPRESLSKLLIKLCVAQAGRLAGHFIGQGRLPERLLYGVTFCLDLTEPQRIEDPVILTLMAALEVWPVICLQPSVRLSTHRALQEARQCLATGPRLKLPSDQELQAGLARIEASVGYERRQVGVPAAFSSCRCLVLTLCT